MPNLQHSPFQMVATQITDFRCVNLLLGSCDAKELEHELTGSAFLEYADDSWRGHIVFRYQAVKRDGDSLSLQLNACSQSFFVYQAEETQEERTRFDRLLKTNGAFSALGIMRTLTNATANALGVRVPILIPNTNLTQFHWQEEKPEDE